MSEISLQEILGYCDHTLLKQESTWEQIREICNDGIKYQTASVCIPPSFVRQARELVGDDLAICTVIGFPNGYNTTAVKSSRPRTRWPTARMRSTWSSTSAG